MGKVIELFREPTPVEEAFNHLKDMCDAIDGIQVSDENSNTLKDIVRENVAMAADILYDYLAEIKGASS